MIPDVRELDDDPTPKGMTDETMPSDEGRASQPLPGDDTGFRCEVCNTTISTPSGRKPRVMLCPEHRVGNKAGDGGTGKKVSRGNHAKIEEGMTAFYGMIGLGLTGVGMTTHDPVWMRDAQLFNINAPRIGAAWADAADQSAKTQKALLKFLESVGFLSLVGAHIPLALGIAANHQAAIREAQQHATAA